jgi:hypothetical protein
MTQYEEYIASNPARPAQNSQPIPADNTKKLAYVIDGKVVQTLATDERMWAIILSQPTIVDITDITFPDEVTEEGTTQVAITTDWNYDGTNFTRP